MLTTDGIDLLWERSLDGGSIRVSDGTNKAEAPFDGPPVINAGMVTVSATFGEKDANFDWLQRDILTKDGVVLDHQEEDLGRKAGGSVWTLDAGIELK